MYLFFPARPGGSFPHLSTIHFSLHLPSPTEIPLKWSSLTPPTKLWIMWITLVFPRQYQSSVLCQLSLPHPGLTLTMERLQPLCFNGLRHSPPFWSANFYASILNNIPYFMHSPDSPPFFSFIHNRTFLPFHLSRIILYFFLVYSSVFVFY